MTSLLPAGEILDVPERVIVATTAGTFEPALPPIDSPDGVRVAEGQVIGTLRGPSSSTAVTSPFTGALMGMMASPGERLRTGEPIAWLRAD
jgi:biotin carboxyl carrier protein